MVDEKEGGYRIMVELEGTESVDPREIGNEIARQVVERQQRQGLIPAGRTIFIRVFLRIIIRSSIT